MMRAYPSRICVACGHGFTPASGRQKACNRVCSRKVINDGRRRVDAEPREHRQPTPQTYLSDGLAACKDKDPELFFPPPGGSAAIAKRICFGCELLQKCRAWALEQPWRQLHGIYGALSFEDRRRAAGGGQR